MKVKKLKKKAKKEIKDASDLSSLNEVYKKYLGKEGEISEILSSLKDLKEEKRKKVGKTANSAKKEIKELINKRKQKIKEEQVEKREEQEKIDVTRPGKKVKEGHLHPLTQTHRKINLIFNSMGFKTVEGPEIEESWYNFDALNIPENHPARDLWDTFWIKDKDKVLRTHTSPVQIRYMKNNEPPLRIIVPGRVFRNETTDASHDAQFYQIEGLMIDRDITVAHFKAVIKEFLEQFFSEENIKTRLRPSFFPFVEPSFEIDIKKEKEWLEVLGAGMVHPNVLKAGGLNPENWQGFAFGVGLDRLTMLKFNIDDVRLFYSGDLRFLKQF